MPAAYKFSIWAMMIALTSVWLNIMGGIIAFWYTNLKVVKGPPIGGYCIAIAVIMFPFVFPVKFMGKLLLITQNYWFMAIACILLSIGCLMTPPTSLGGITLVFAGIVYIIAAVRGEKQLTVNEITGARAAA